MLTKESRENGLIPPKFPVDFLPAEGGNRPYPADEERRHYKMPVGSVIWGYEWDPIQSVK